MTEPVFIMFKHLFLSFSKRDIARMPVPAPMPAAVPAVVQTTVAVGAAASAAVGASEAHDHSKNDVMILFGSNMGTSEEFAQKLVGYMKQLNFRSAAISSLDDFAKTLEDKKGQELGLGGRSTLLLIVTSTYNGKPPDNAMAFEKLLRDGKTGKELGAVLSGVRYAVFGCGNHLWKSTFQAFPVFIDRRLAELGCVPILSVGAGDAEIDLDNDFDQWSRELVESLGSSEGLPIDMGPTRRLKVEFLKDFKGEESRELLVGDVTSRLNVLNSFKVMFLF